MKNVPLADVGLEPDTIPVVTTQVTAGEGADASHEQVDVGEIEFGYVDYVPIVKRIAGGSKYKFDQLESPGVHGDGLNKGKPKFAAFTVKLQEGVDPDKLRRSVQSATTQANRQGHAAGKYFVSRSLTDNGVFVGMQVIRTDAKPAKG